MLIAALRRASTPICASGSSMKRVDDRLARLLRSLGGHAVGGEGVEQAAQPDQLILGEPGLEQRDLDRHRHAEVASPSGPRSRSGRRLAPSAGGERRDEGVAEDRERRPLGVVEELRCREGRHRLADLRRRPRRCRGTCGARGAARRRGRSGATALRVLADAVGAVARAESRLLPAAHRQLERAVVDLRVVDAGDAGLDPPGQRLAALDVAGPDRGLQAVAAVVGELDRLLGVG